MHEAVDQLGDRERAARWLKIALADAERQPDLAETVDVYLAASHYATAIGEFDDGVRWGARASEVATRLLGADSLQRASALELTAAAYDLGGKGAEAIAMYDQQVAIVASWFGDDSSRLNPARMNLALAHSALGDHALAVALATRVVASARATAAQAPLSFGRDLLNLGVILGEAHDFRGSIAPLEEARTVLTGVLGPVHPDVALVATALVRSHAELVPDGDRDGLRDLLAEARAAVALARRANGPDHPETATAEQNLANALVLVGRCAEAAPVIDHVIATHLRSGNQVVIAMPLRLRGDCARTARDWRGAARWYRRAIDALAEGNLRDRAESRRRLADVLLQAGDRAGAIDAMTARRRELAEMAPSGELAPILAAIDRWLAAPAGEPP